MISQPHISLGYEPRVPAACEAPVSKPAGTNEPLDYLYGDREDERYASPLLVVTSLSGPALHIVQNRIR